MKNICLLFAFCLVSEINAQETFKLQLKLNVIPFEKFYYSGGARLGIETLHRKYNYGIHFVAFHLDEENKETFRQDSLFYRTKFRETNYIKGLAASIMRSFPFRYNRNKLLVGIQGFVGADRKIDYSQRFVYDTTIYHLPNGHRFRFDNGWRTLDQYEVKESHGPKLSLVFSAFLRLELAVTKRFTFSPELQFPFMVHNQIGGQIFTDANPGFNFCLGYKFIRNKKPAGKPVDI